MEDATALDGFTVGVTAERKAEELGQALARKGARVLYGPAMHTVPLPEDGALRTVTEQVLAAPVDVVVAVTGAGFRGWFEAAEAHGRHQCLVEHLRSATVLARGAKARGAVRSAGLHETWTAPSEEIAEIRDHLLDTGVAGARIVVQLHGDPMQELRERLRQAGAEVVPVTVYRWTDPPDLAPLDRLIDAVIEGEVDALPLTSAPAASNVLARAENTGRAERFHRAVRERVLLACVGPVTAAPIARAELPYTMPDRARTGPLVRLVADELPARAR